MTDYDEDFFISSSARPFESLGIMSTTSQFFPGMYAKGALERSPPDDADDLPPSPPPAPPPPPTRTPSLDFTTPDSGVEDITPGSVADDDFRRPKPDDAPCWRPADTPSSSESASPASPADALGGLRHTRDKLKLDLPPSPAAASPRHARVFSFALDKPRRRDPAPDSTPADPAPALVPAPAAPPPPPPTFSTFGKPAPRAPEPPEPAPLVLTDAPAARPAPPAPTPDPAPLDSGDEDSGIESSSKATLERTDTSAPNVS